VFGASGQEGRPEKKSQVDGRAGHPPGCVGM